MVTKPTTYTQEFVLAEVRDILNTVETNVDMVFIGEALAKKPYARQRYSEWAHDFEQNADIVDAIKRTKGILETRINSGGLKNKLNTAMVIFNLKNNYNWSDRQEVKLSGDANQPIAVSVSFSKPQSQPESKQDDKTEVK
jgi:hypothetical protein